MGLSYEGKSFDDNQIGKGSIQAQNVCVLAKYGNAGTITEPATPDCAGESNHDLDKQQHWFGNCDMGGKCLHI